MTCSNSFAHLRTLLHRVCETNKWRPASLRELLGHCCEHSRRTTNRHAGFGRSSSQQCPHVGSRASCHRDKRAETVLPTLNGKRLLAAGAFCHSSACARGSRVLTRIVQLQDCASLHDRAGRVDAETAESGHGPRLPLQERDESSTPITHPEKQRRKEARSSSGEQETAATGHGSRCHSARP